MRISAKSDYAVRTMIELAVRETATCETIAESQSIPHKYLEAILVHLRNTGFVVSQRGQHAGYRLAKTPDSIAVADILRAVDGPIATVRGECPHDLHYDGSAKTLQPLWIAVRANIRAVLETVTIADLAEGTLPPSVHLLTTDPEAWSEHWYR